MKKKNMAVLWVVCFLALLIIPRAVWTVTKDNYETVVTENTVVTEIPKLTKDNWKSYGQSLEDYYNSNVPFRSQLIQANSLLNVNVLKERFINEKVVIGDDNWLFYCEETNIEDYKGTNLYPEEELAAMAQNLLNVRQQLADKNCEFVIFLAPNKETVYSEYLPSYIQDMKKGELTRARQVVDYLKNNTDLRIVWPEEELLAYKDQYSLYWHYDTHWNVGGGYIGTRELLEELGMYLPPVEEVNYTPNDFSDYDLARMMNLWDYYKENRPAEEDYFVSGYPYNNMQVIQGAGTAPLQYKSEAPETRKLFMVYDSFAGAMINVLASSFAESYLVGWNSTWNPAQVDEQQPDIFVLELVERRLDYLSTFSLTE